MSALKKLSRNLLMVFDTPGQAKVIATDPEANTITLQVTEGVTAKMDVSEYVTKINLESDVDVQTIESFNGKYAQLDGDGRLIYFSDELKPVEKVATGTTGKTCAKEVPAGLKL